MFIDIIDYIALTFTDMGLLSYAMIMMFGGLLLRSVGLIK